MKNLFDKQYENLAVAYQKTIYRCLNPLLELHIGEVNPEVEKLLLTSEYGNLCILTAYNPKSCIQKPEENQQSQNLLVSELVEAGYHVLEGVNIDPKGCFPNERTCWITEMSFETGLRLASKWEQNAFVYYHKGGRPELIWVNSIFDTL